MARALSNREAMPAATFELSEEAIRRLADHLAERLTERPDPEPWIGVQDAAAHMGCKPQRVYDLVHARTIPHARDGSRLLFRRSELDAYLKGERVT